VGLVAFKTVSSFGIQSCSIRRSEVALPSKPNVAAVGDSAALIRAAGIALPLPNLCYHIHRWDIVTADCHAEITITAKVCEALQ
jgi:hypothetical protein